jgi:23S rRNA-/tRNA-specific pseudouridylate synthase
MTALGYGAARGRTAASNYRLLRRVGGGAAALVEWKLETGRTHQIRWMQGCRGGAHSPCDVA